ncbi:hypothetical protein [Selenomonas flueggei]|uniref:hypothetical protein n=1 Tax=Selenomonas flueggei TaxID=135080 RepID=UPI0026725254|nr:hypothetical protein [Selenomonas flueggei]
MMKGSEEHGRYTFAASAVYEYSVLSSLCSYDAVTAGEDDRKGAFSLAADL